MADEFQPITTQEQLNEVIGDRLKRERESTSKKYEGYTSPGDLEKIKKSYEKQIADMQTASDAAAKKYADYDKQIADRDAKIKGYETASVKARTAHEVGLPYDAIQFIQGDNEKDIKASAESLKSLMGAQKTPSQPLHNSESTGGGNKAGMAAIVRGLRGEN